MVVQAALSKVVARPGQQPIEGLTVIRGQREEQRVALPFRGADFARVARVNDAPALADVILLNCSQAGQIQAARRFVAASINAANTHQRKAFITAYSLSGFRRRRLIIRSRRHSTHASNTTLTAARIASSTGWLDRAYHRRSNHGRWPT